jgi:hypothetical protein
MTREAEVMAKLHRSIFLKAVKAAFPELTGELNSNHGLLHIEMHVLTNFTQRQIDQGNHATLAKCYEIADECLRHGNASLQNAIFVSFLEHLNFTDGKVLRRWAWDAMPDSLRQGHQWIMAKTAETFARYNKIKHPTKK